MTIEHVDIGAGEIHEPKGISSAAVGSVYEADGLGSGSWIVEAAGNEIIVNSMADFPAAAAGVRTLDDDTRYVLAAGVTTSDRFVLGSNTQITSFSTISPVFEYTGTGAMFTAIDNTVLIQDIRLNCPNGEVFNFSDVATPNTNIGFIKDVLINNAAKFGTFDSLISLVITDTSCFNATDGITLAGTGWRVWRFQDIGMISTSATFVGVDLGLSECAGILFQTSLFTMTDPAAIAFKGAASSANVPVGSIGRISNMNTPAVGIALSGLTTDDIRWSFFDNDAVPDTMPDSFITMTGNATATTIAVTGTPVLIAGTWTEEQSSQFTTTAAGRITYNGERNLKAPILASLSCRMVSGSDTDVTFSLYKNGVQIAASQQGNTVKAAATGNTSIMWQDDIAEGDYFELFVANEDGTINILVEDAKFLIN